MNEKSITDAARWIVDQHSQKKNYANLPESFVIGGLDEAYKDEQEVVRFFQNQRGGIGGHKLALTSKPIQQLCGLDHPCAVQLFHSENSACKIFFIIRCKAGKSRKRVLAIASGFAK